MGKAAFNREEFCAEVGISCTTLDKLNARGRGPRTFRVLGKVLISADALREWVAARENPGPEEAAEQAATARRHRERAIAATAHRSVSR